MNDFFELKAPRLKVILASLAFWFAFVGMEWPEWERAAYKYAWETNVKDIQYDNKGKPSDILERLYKAGWTPEQAIDYIRYTR